MEKKLENIEKIKLVMWDLDGTILDSRDAHFRSVQIVFKNNGFQFPMDGSDNFFGQTTAHIFKTILVNSLEDEKIDAMLREKELIFQEIIQEGVNFLPGVQNWLNEFGYVGVTQSIVSSTALESIRVTVKALDAGKYFSRLFSGEGLPSKPDPAVFSMAINHFGVASENCLVIEDSPHGIQAAKSLGIKCIAPAVTFPPDQLSEADLVVDNLEQLQWEDIGRLFPGD
jgi:HAD superfamily hydrolase (TIGR01509 family)